MMSKTQYLLLKLAEECSEVAQRCSKQMQFGADEVQPGQEKNNRERLGEEFNDLLSVAKMLIEEGEIPFQTFENYNEALAKKRAKIEKYYKKSQEAGLVI